MERCVELRWRREEHRQNLQRLETEMARGAGLPAEPAAGTRNDGLAAWPSAAATRPVRLLAATSVTTPRPLRSNGIAHRGRVRSRRVRGDADRRS